MTQQRMHLGNDTLERTRYFPRQIVSPDDLRQDCEYLLDKMRRLNRIMHGPQKKIGLEVKMVPKMGEPKSKQRIVFEDFVQTLLANKTNETASLPCEVKPNDGTWLVVTPGYALTQAGDEIYLPDFVFIDTSKEIKDALLAVPSTSCGNLNAKTVGYQPGQTYHLIVDAYEAECRPVRAASSRCGDHPDSFEFARVKDTIRFRLSIVPLKVLNDRTLLLGPAPEDAGLCLGDVKFEQGTILVTAHGQKPPAQAPPEQPPLVSQPAHVDPKKEHWLYQLWKDIVSFFRTIGNWLFSTKPL